MSDETLSMSQAVARARGLVSATTIRVWVSRGKVEMVGSRRYRRVFDAASLERCLDKRRAALRERELRLAGVKPRNKPRGSKKLEPLSARGEALLNQLLEARFRVPAAQARERLAQRFSPA